MDNAPLRSNFTSTTPKTGKARRLVSSTTRWTNMTADKVTMPKKAINFYNNKKASSGSVSVKKQSPPIIMNIDNDPPS